MKKLIFLIAILAAVSVQAQTTWVVASLNDSGFGSLRAAADSCASGDTIRFNPNLIANGSDSIVLTSGEIAFGNVGVVIVGLYNAFDTLSISGGNSSRIFSFENSGKVVLDSMLLKNGNSQGSQLSGYGGAILWLGCTDTLFVKNSEVIKNVAQNNGGGVYLRNPGCFSSAPCLVIENSMVSRNVANSQGGGICIEAYSSSIEHYGIVKILNSTISDNSASFGGGVSVSSSTINFVSTTTKSLIFIEKSTISGNVAGKGAGVWAISDRFSRIEVFNSTVVENVALVGFGGGIVCSSGVTAMVSKSNININNSTVWGNSALNGIGAGIYSESDTSEIFIENSILAENGLGSSGIYNTDSTTIISSGFNIFSDSLVGMIGLDFYNISSSQLDLGALSYNGGSTQTMVPGVASVAQDSGSPTDSSDAQNAPVVGVRNRGAAEDCYSFPEYLQVTECSDYTLPSGNNSFTNSGRYFDTLLTVCGADSVLIIDLEILGIDSSIENVTSCFPVTWLDGVTYYHSVTGPFVTMQNNRGCDSVVALDFILIEVDTSVVRQVYSLTANASNASYQWIDCEAGVLIGETNANFTPQQNGSFRVEVTQNGCVDTSDCITVNNVGIGEVSLSNNINIYPNPVHDQVNIEWINGVTKNTLIRIRDLSGKLIYSQELKPFGSPITETIETSNWASGTYIVEISEGENRVIRKIIVNKSNK